MKFKERHRKNYLDRVKFYCDNQVDIDQYEHHLEEKSDRFVKESKSNLLDVLGHFVIALILILIVTVPMIATGLTIKLFGGIEKYNEYKNTLVTEDVNISTVSYTEDILANPQAIVNFNQYVEDLYTHNYTFNNNINVANLGGTDSSHKYYIRFNFESTVDYVDLYIGNYGIGRRYLPGDNKIIDTYGDNNTYVDLRPSSGVNCNIINFWMIDLTQMFGVGNEPSLDQCNDLFIADYYSYNSGTAMSLTGFNSFTQGINYVYDMLGFDLVNYSAYSSAYIDPNLNNSNAFITRFSDNGSLYFQARGYCSIPLSTTIEANSIVKFSYYDPGQGGSGNYIWVGILYNNSFIPVMQVAHNENDELGEFSFTCPFSTNTLIFVESEQENYFAFSDTGYWIGDLKVYNAKLDLDVLINSIVDDELRKQKEEITGYYTYGTGYNSIYRTGYNDGLIAQNPYTFATLFTSVIEAPLGAILSMFNFEFLGVNLKNVITLIFTLCLLVTIIRLFMGGK